MNHLLTFITIINVHLNIGINYCLIFRNTDVNELIGPVLTSDIFEGFDRMFHL